MKVLIILGLLFISKPHPVKIKEYSLIPRLISKVTGYEYAITVGRTIYVSGSVEEFTSNKRWLRHEMAHVAQYDRLGVVEFLKRYIFFTVIYGYKNNPLEKEARAHEKE